jgi:hypothetical protein
LNEFEYVWRNLFPKHEDTNPEIFSFAFQCQQGINVSNYVDRVLEKDPHLIEKEGKGPRFIDFILVDRNDYDDVSLIYMKSILQTLINKFNNMFVQLINHVLEINEKDCQKTMVEYCAYEDFMTYFNYEPLIETNFWYNTDTSKENEIQFDMKRIEYLCALTMKKKWINFEEADLKYYEFKDIESRKTENMVEGMLPKIQKIEVDDLMQRQVREMSEDQALKSFGFILEIGEYIYQNFLFNNSEKYLKTIINEIDNPIIRKRFGSYDEKLHSRLKVGHLVEYYDLIQERKFDLYFTLNRVKYSAKVSEEDKHKFEEIIADFHLSGDDIEKIKIDLKDIIRQNYQREEMILKMSFAKSRS